MKKLILPIYALAAAVVFTGGAAFAQSKNTSQNISSPAPWYERFTFGSQFNSNVNAWTPRGETKANIKVSPKSKWGVSLGMLEQPQNPTILGKGQASAGAFYDINKNLRLGGQVVLEEENIAALNGDKRKEKNRTPGVKVESAFRF